MKLTNKQYDALVFIAQIVLPAIAVFSASMIEIWSLPFKNEIPMTIMAIDTLLGALLKLSAINYKKEMK
jgi:hypothetical protein